MNRKSLVKKVVVVLLGACAGFGMLALPSMVYAQSSSVGTAVQLTSVEAAKVAIDNYFSVLLSGQNPSAAKVAMDQAMAAVVNTADRSIVNNYYGQTAIIQAKAAVDNYFAALMAAQNPAIAKTVMEAAMAAVLNPSDKLIVSNYYGQTAIVKAKAAIDKYFAALMAAQNPAIAKTVMEAAIAAVLNSSDKLIVSNYYGQTAIVKAKAAVDNYFVALMAAQDPAIAKTVMEAAMAAVLNPSDRLIVNNYYGQTAIVKAKAAVDNYFSALMAAQNPAIAKTVMEAAMAAVLNPSDKLIVNNYYGQTAIVKAKAAVDNYFSALMAAQNPAIAKTVMEAAMAAVLNPSDRLIVNNYYGQTAIVKAKVAIDNYFSALAAGQNPATAKAVMEAVMATVLNAADKTIVANYYSIGMSQMAVNKAKAAIDDYFATLLIVTKNPAQAKLAMDSAIAAVLNPAEKAIVGDYYNQSAVTNSKITIDNYFQVLLAAVQNPVNAKLVMDRVIATVLNPADKTAIGQYLDQVAVTKAKAAIDNYFTVLSAGNEDPAKAKFVMTSLLATVLNPADKTAIGQYLDQVAVTKAKAAIDNYFTVLSAGNEDPAKAKFVMTSLLATVLNPADKTAIGQYLDQVAVTKAKVAIDNYFTVLSAGNEDPAKAKFVMTSLLATVLNPADKTAIGQYLDQVAVTKAKVAIDNYFTVLSAGNEDPAKAKFVMTSLLATVLNPADKTTIGQYYDQTAVLKAQAAINSYVSILAQAKDPAKEKFVMESIIAVVLNPADKTNVGNYYDSKMLWNTKYAMNKYFQNIWALKDPAKAKFVMDSFIAAIKKPADKITVGEYYSNLDNLSAGRLATPQFNIGFAQSVAVLQESNELFVGAPSVNGKGVVYQYKSMPVDATQSVPVPAIIAPVGLADGDQFGKTLAANKDALVVQAQSSLYFFSKVNNAWVQAGNKLDLSKIDNLDPALVSNMKLALSSDSLAVSLPSAKVVYVISRSNGTWAYAATLKLSGVEAGKVQFAQSVAVGDGIIAVGAPKASETEKSKIFIYRYKGQGLWTLEKTYENDIANFGQEIGLLTPQNAEAVLTATKVVGHQLIVALSAVPDITLLSNVFIFNEMRNAPYGAPVSTWNTSYSRLSLPWHSSSAIISLTAKDNTVAVAMHPKTFSLGSIHTTDSVIVFKRQANNSFAWAYNLAGAGILNFGQSIALSGDTVVAAYPQDQDTSTVKSGVIVLSPKL
jgi:hypothetical protein